MLAKRKKEKEKRKRIMNNTHIQLSVFASQVAGLEPDPRRLPTAPAAASIPSGAPAAAYQPFMPSRLGYRMLAAGVELASHLEWVSTPASGS